MRGLVSFAAMARGHPERAQRVEKSARLFAHRLVATLRVAPYFARSVRQPFTLAPAMTHPSVMRRAGAGALVLIALLAPRALVGQSAADRRATTPADVAARAALRALPDSTRAGATFSFDSTERSNWFYVPIDRKGVTLGRMTAEARARVDSLLLSGLSSRGFATAKSIMRHEAILHDIEAAGPPEARRFVRDSNKYYLSVFGEPDASTAWGWRVEGHHLSVNYTGIGRDAQVVSPVFFGANPAKVLSGPHAGLRILAAEEDLARELVKMLDAKQRAVAVFSDTALVEIETRNDPKARTLKSEGLRAADMVRTRSAPSSPPHRSLRWTPVGRRARARAAATWRTAASASCASPGRAAPRSARRTTTASTARRSSSSTTTSRRTRTTSTPCGATCATTSAAICSPSTTGSTSTPLPSR